MRRNWSGIASDLLQPHGCHVRRFYIGLGMASPSKAGDSIEQQLIPRDLDQLHSWHDQMQWAAWQLDMFDTLNALSIPFGTALRWTAMM